MKPDDLYAEHNSPEDWYRLWRWMDRVFAKALGWHVQQGARIPRGVVPRAPSPQHREIVASIDIDRMGHRERYLIKVLLVRQGLYRRSLREFPNLRGLEDVDGIDEPIVLSKTPRGAYDPWLREQGVIL